VPTADGFAAIIGEPKPDQIPKPVAFYEVTFGTGESSGFNSQDGGPIVEVCEELIRNAKREKKRKTFAVGAAVVSHDES
jgi:hypothetical protein